MTQSEVSSHYFQRSCGQSGLSSKKTLTAPPESYCCRTEHAHTPLCISFPCRDLSTPVFGWLWSWKMGLVDNQIKTFKEWYARNANGARFVQQTSSKCPQLRFIWTPPRTWRGANKVLIKIFSVLHYITQNWNHQGCLSSLLPLWPKHLFIYFVYFSSWQQWGYSWAGGQLSLGQCRRALGCRANTSRSTSDQHHRQACSPTCKSHQECDLFLKQTPTHQMSWMPNKKKSILFFFFFSKKKWSWL